MSVRLGPILITTEGILLACALVLFLAASHRGLRGMPGLSVRKVGAVLAIVSLCGFFGAVLYGIPGTLAAMREDSALPLRGALAFGSFGGYWGVLLGGWLAARVLRQAPLPILDALVPAMLLGGALARAEVLFQAQPATGAVAAWAVSDIAAQTLLAALMVMLERPRSGRMLPNGAIVVLFLLGYGLLRFALECFRSDFPLIGPITWGQAMSAAQVVAGAVMLALLILPTARR